MAAGAAADGFTRGVSIEGRRGIRRAALPFFNDPTTAAEIGRAAGADTFYVQFPEIPSVDRHWRSKDEHGKGANEDRSDFHDDGRVRPFIEDELQRYADWSSLCAFSQVVDDKQEEKDSERARK